MSISEDDIPEGGWLCGDVALVAYDGGEPRLWRREGEPRSSAPSLWRMDGAGSVSKGVSDVEVSEWIEAGMVLYAHMVERPPAVDPLLPTRPGSIIFGKVGDVESVFVLDSDGDWEGLSSAFGYSNDHWVKPADISEWVELVPGPEAPVDGDPSTFHRAWKSGAPTVPVRRETIQRLLDSRPFRWGGAMEPADFVLREVVGDR